MEGAGAQLPEEPSPQLQVHAGGEHSSPSAHAIAGQAQAQPVSPPPSSGASWQMPLRHVSPSRQGMPIAYQLQRESTRHVASCENAAHGSSGRPTQRSPGQSAVVQSLELD